MKLNLFKNITLLLTLCFCYSSLATDDELRFEAKIDGTVLDTVTGLMWMRCSTGQTFSVTDAGEASCEGLAEQKTWKQALMTAQSAEFAGYSDWQLPDYKQLASLVARQRVTPAIDEDLFPGMPDDATIRYWTSTSAIERMDYAWVYDFSDGRNTPHAKSKDNYIRLVRYNQ